ncbi:RTC4-like domain-containing protein [Nemania abortiva]|nr:RTC4-like domain-containing protein [Nemania abortiva]
MTGRRSMILAPRRIGLNKNFSGGPPLSQIHGKAIVPGQRRKVKASSFAMKGDSDPLYDPITAPPESSDDEAGDVPVKPPNADDIDDSDEEYDRRRTADIRGTNFNKATSTTSSSALSSKPKIRPPRAYKGNAKTSRTDDLSSLAGSKRAAEEDRPKGPNQLEKELEAPRQKKKKQPVTKYGLQQKTKRQYVHQSTSSTSKDDPTSSQDSVQPTPGKRPFHRVESISPMKSRSPRKAFKIERRISDWDELEDSKPSFKMIPDSSSPMPTPAKHRPRHMSPVDEDEDAEDKKQELTKPVDKEPDSNARLPKAPRRKKSKRRKSSPKPSGEFSQRPVFKIPGLDDIDSFDDDGSLGATGTSGGSHDTSWDHLELEELESTTTPRCPMCNDEVDGELIKKYSTNGKMSVKEQTAFCRLHKRRSAETAGMKKGYPKIDWHTLNSRCSAHKDFLQDILEGTQVSHYRAILKEKVDSGKNRTLLKSQDNLTPGYYGPRGLQAMTGFIMNSLSDVIRRRAVEDKLISARSYTGYVQSVLVPELTVRLIMEDMSVTEERARDVLEESVEIGELLHEEARDVVRIEEKEDDTLLET